ncbi:MAG: hypothetical protein QF368_01595, partial [SAR202 cluster bacterium]|nr:hypothetical protein [SAR202 cluster bacterium]
PMTKWIVVFGIAVFIVAIGSVGRIPFTERDLATTEETRTEYASDNTPTYPRAQALAMVKDHVRENCSSGDKYLLNESRFEANWTRITRTNDHHIRMNREWTVTDPATGAYWRLYEDTLEIVNVIGDC